MRCSVSIVILILISTGLLRAQNFTDTTGYSIHIDSNRVNGARLSFDHLLSIYEWNTHVDYIPGFIGEHLWNSGSLDTLQLSASSRFLQDNSITSTSASGYLWADLPSAVEDIRPFASVFASSYVTTGLPGSAAARLITKQVDGFGIAGLHYSDNSLDVSAGGGFAHEAQQSISAAGGVLRGTLGMPSQFVGGATQFGADAVIDERFFHERSERYSNDQANFSVASGLLAQGISSLDSNHAFLGLSLQRRDFFFTTDSTTNTVKQERTELALSLRDSLRIRSLPTLFEERSILNSNLGPLRAKAIYLPAR